MYVCMYTYTHIYVYAHLHILGLLYPPICQWTFRLLPRLAHCKQCLMTKDSDVRHDTIKFLEEKVGKTVSDVNHTNVFLGQFPKAIG